MSSWSWFGSVWPWVWLVLVWLTLYGVFAFLLCAIVRMRGGGR